VLRSLGGKSLIWEVPMTLETYVSGLRKKHAKLSSLVDREQKRPAPNFVTLTDLKKQKLHLKQEISKALEIK